MKRKVNKKALYIIGLILLSLPAAFYLLLPGFYEPHDLHHLADIYEMYRAIISGQIPPRLGPDFVFGYGYPLFNFYYPLPFYLGALFFFLFGSLTLSFKLVFFTSILFSVFGMYLFLKEFVSKKAAFVGALLFLYTPYRAVEIYVRGAMGEALALSLLPFVFWILTKLVRKADKQTVVKGALITALFLIAHNYLSFLIAPFLLVFLLIIIPDRKKAMKALGQLLGVGFLSLGLTAYWWVPALLEQKLIDRLTPFLLVDHFPFIKQLILPSWGYGSSVWGPGDEISFQIGLVNLAVVAIAMVSLFLRKKRLFQLKLWKITLWAMGGFIVSVLLMNIRTLPFWKLIPFYNFIQFPWRLLILTTFFTSFLAAVVTEVYKKNSLLVLGIVFGSIALTFSYFRPSEVFFKSDNDYLSRFFANQSLSGEKKEVAEEYLNYSEDYLLLPNWVDEKPTRLPENKIEIENGEIIEITKTSPVNWQANFVANELTTLTFNNYYFPGWYAEIDGKKVEVKSGRPHGQIEIEVDKGEYEVKFYWGETKLRKIVDIVSLVSFLILGTFFVKNKFRKK